MKSNLIKVAFVAAIAMVSSINVFNAQKSEPLSEIALANVEALANFSIRGFEEDWRLVENNLYSIQLPSSWNSMNNYLNKMFFERKVEINGVPVNLYTTAWQKETENIIDAAGLIINSYEILDNKRLSYQDLQSILKEGMSVSIVKTLKSFVTDMRKEYVFLKKSQAMSVSRGVEYHESIEYNLLLMDDGMLHHVMLTSPPKDEKEIIKIFNSFKLK